MTKVFSVAALIASMATSSFAGTLASTNDNTVLDDVFVPAGSSSGSGIAVPLAIAGGLLAIGLLASDDDNSTVTSSSGDRD